MPRKNFITKPKHQPFQPSGGSCTGKVSYPTKKAAEMVAEETMALSYSLKLRVYQCLKCGKWHLTTVKPLESS